MRGRRGGREFAVASEGGIVYVGRDSQFEGLEVPLENGRQNHNVVAEGVNINLRTTLSTNAECRECAEHDEGRLLGDSYDEEE